MSGFISQKEIERSQRDCRKIENFLMENGKASFTEISIKCGISKIKLESRIKTMRRENRIRYAGRDNGAKSESYYEIVLKFGEIAQSMADYPKTYLSWGGYAA